MPTFIYDRATDRMVDKATGEPMNPEGAPLAAPRVFSDLPGYRSPIDGKWIEGRRARAYDLESNNCIEAPDLKLGGKLKNERFAKKHGLQHLLD